MPAAPQVSVIIPFFNSSDFLEETIGCVFDQTFQDWELLLVDDGSSDGSADLAKRYMAQYPRQVRYLAHPDHANRGTAATRNLGIANSRGKYIAFLDADDIWVPKKLADQVAVLEADANIALTYGRGLFWFSWSAKSTQPDFLQEFDELGCPVDVPITPPEWIKLILLGKAVPSPTGLLIRSDIVRKVNGFDDRFYHGEDIVFYIKVGLSNSVYVFGDCQYKYRKHAKSKVSGAAGKRWFRYRFKIARWFGQYMKENRVDDPELWKIQRRLLAIYGKEAVKELVPQGVKSWLKRRLSRPSNVTSTP